MGSTKATPTTLTPTDHMRVGSTIIDQGTYDELLFRGYDLRSINSRDANNEDMYMENLLIGFLLHRLGGRNRCYGR